MTNRTQSSESLIDETKVNFDQLLTQLQEKLNLCVTQVNEHLNVSTPDTTEHSLEAALDQTKGIREYLFELEALILTKLENKSTFHTHCMDTVRRKINGILYTLIDQINVPEDFFQRKNTLRAELNDIADWDVLPNILSESASLVFISNSLHQHEFEGFLQSLNSKLSEIHDSLRESKEIENLAVQAEKHLDDQVQNSINHFNAKLDSTNDLSELKKIFHSNLENLLNLFKKYQHHGSSNRTTVVEKLDRLSNRIAGLENDTHRLRSVIEKQREESLKDTLTGLPNRQSYEEQGFKEVSRFHRHGHALSLCVADIDFFKKINDEHGHLAGDRVLRLVSQTMQQRLRNSDLIYRYGGEEFVILMPDTVVKSALLAINQLREEIEHTEFLFHNQKIHITVSFGVTEIESGDSLEDAFERADKALYEAKRSGRNQAQIN